MHPSPRRSRVRAQAAPLSVILLLAIVILGTTAVVVLGSVALQNTERASELERASNEMTLFDSRVATVALGASPSQTIQLGASGTYYVEPDAGWIKITHHNWSNNAVADDDEVIYKGTLGAVVLRNGDTTIAYQGGGVWRLGPTGDARMVSPPEFHYRDSTLTLPVIRVTGDGASSGAATVHITQRQVARDVFPNVSTNYGTSGPPYHNPAENGSMSITVHSAYYEAWADYFRSRSEGNIEVHHNNNTVVLDLYTLGEHGAFEMPGDIDSADGGGEVTIRGLQGGHALTNFTIVLFDDDGDSADFSNLQWSMYAEEGNKQLELHLTTRDAPAGRVKVAIYYSSNDGSTYQGWMNVSAFEIETGNFDGDGGTEKRIVANFTGDTKLTYSKLDKSDVNVFDPQQGNLVDPVKWNEHQDTVSYEPVTFTKGEETTINNVTNHFFALMGTEFDLKVDDKRSNTVNEDASYGNIEYPGTARFINYLHVTENVIVVEID